jgi:hypothetical protein
MEFLLSLLIRLCQGAQGNTKILMYYGEIGCYFSVDRKRLGQYAVASEIGTQKERRG